MKALFVFIEKVSTSRRPDMPPASREGEMAAGIARSAGPRSTAARQIESIKLGTLSLLKRLA